MLKKLKNPIFTFILGAIIFGTISGVIAYSLNAKEVGFTPKDTTWNVENTKEALDDLHSRLNCVSGVYNKLANTFININVGFTPKKYYLQWKTSDGYTPIVYYNSDLNSNTHMYNVTSETYTDLSNLFFIENGKILEKNTNISIARYKENLAIYYTACK